jgi:phosphotransferase system HPr (HPr) family protein
MSVSSEATINNSKGIHARPSSEIAREALKYKSTVTITYNNKSANAKDVLQLIMLELFQGTNVIITAEGDDEKEALENIKKYVEKIYEYD